MASCAVDGGCPSDYVAISISLISIILLVARSTLPCLVHKSPPPVNGSGLWIQIIQIFASFNLLVSLVIPLNFLDFKKRHWWQSCYLWEVWVEGPLGFGLLLSCRIVQAFHLYNIFVKRRLPPIRTYIFLPLILVPWIAVATFIHVWKPLNTLCHMRTQWNIPVMCLHISYVLILIGFTGSMHHIKFRFHELKDLWQGIVVSAISVGLWVASYFLNIYNGIAWLQITSRFLLLLTGSVLVQALFSISSSQRLLLQMSLLKRDMIQCQTMGRALGIPDSGMLLQKEPALLIHPEEPLDKLLLNRRFRQSFMAFADSCLAGESVHFYDDVNELGKIHVEDPVRRIYMARHIIERYIVTGAVMEVNISHRSRQEILTTSDLAHPRLFKNAENELLQLMNMNLAKDYWSSMYFLKLKEEAAANSSSHELEQGAVLDFSPRVSSVQANDDPFHQDLTSRDSIRMQEL